MIRLFIWKWTILVCVLAVAVGVLHGMTHIEFDEYSSQFLKDIEKFCELVVTQYASRVAVRLGYDKRSDKLKEATDHYHLMMNRAQPLFEIYIKDVKRLIDFMDHLESFTLTKKSLYSYFRQSAINLIDHLKLVYNLE